MDLVELLLKVEEGNESPLKAYAMLKEHSKNVAEAIKQIEEFAFDDASQYGEKTFEDFGYKFELKEGRRIWDFSQIAEWNEIESKRKFKESMYKAASSAYEKGTQMVDENGEVVPFPKVKYSKQSIVVKAI